jgi:hypothetical protein
MMRSVRTWLPDVVISMSTYPEPLSRCVDVVVVFAVPATVVP